MALAQNLNCLKKFFGQYIFVKQAYKCGGYINMPPKLCLGWHGTKLRRLSLSLSLSHTHTHTHTFITAPLSVQSSRVSDPEDWPIRTKSYLGVEIKFRQSSAGIPGRVLVSKGGENGIN